MTSIIAKPLPLQGTGHTLEASEFIGDLLEIDASQGAGERVDRFLARVLPRYSRTRLQRWIDQGAVRWDEQVLGRSYRLVGTETLQVEPQAIEADQAFRPEPVPLVIIDEDEAILVLDKPAGLVVHPAAGNWQGTLLNGLLHHDSRLAQLPRAGIVHRLDKDTSGLMVVAKTEAAMLSLGRQLAERSMGRRYLALVVGLTPLAGSVNAPIGRDPTLRTRMAVVQAPQSKPARTDYRRLAVGHSDSGPLSLLECRLHTGRTHQIRVHLQHLGYPLVGDPLYGRRGATGFSRQALHAWQLTLRHPEDEHERTWRAEPPAELRSLFESMGIDLREALALAQRPFGSAESSE